MQVYKQHALLNATLRKIKLNSVGLVPTMGALHQGHLALVKKATEENQKVIVTIFINPTQFNNLEDLANYPSTLETDLIALTPLKEKILLYVPEVSDLYQSSPKPEHYHFGALESYMEGEARPGHFQGVATIVHKLFTLFQPTRAYFGEKDYQQLRIIHALVKLHKPYVEVIDCPIVRHDDGLAMSSRNQRLSAKERRQAPLVFETLSKAAKMKHQRALKDIITWVKGVFERHPDFELEYFCVSDSSTLAPQEELKNQGNYRAFIAVKIGEIRLIDNIKF